MKRRLLLTAVLVGVVVCIAFSAGSDGRFTPAKDLPRGALVYAEVSDLPAILKLWESSDFKTKYLESQNFRELKNRHLGLKLASRWQEFSDAAGFPLDLAMFSAIADKRAAIAIYDIGKLEFVFIAPLSPEAFAATQLMQSGANFTEEEIKDGVTVMRVNVDADRGRQKQELLFVQHKGKIVVATGEKLLVRTLANLDGESHNDRLSDEPSFSQLSQRSTPGAIAVWVNQTALNNDYYFKRYWLPSDISSLKKIKAGIFSFSIEENALAERRVFLLDHGPDALPANIVRAGELLAHAPKDIPYLRLTAADAHTASHYLANTIFGSAEDRPEKPGKRFRLNFSDFGSTFIDGLDASNESFEEQIDDIDEEESPETPQPGTGLSQALSSGSPNAVLMLARPVLLAHPLFVEFQRSAVFRLESPGEFDRHGFESAIERSLSARTMITGAHGFEWKSVAACGAAVRRIDLPMLRWSVSYALTGDKLFVSNDRDFLCESITSSAGPNTVKAIRAVTDFTIIDVERTKQDFQDIFETLAGDGQKNDLFAGNIGGLIETIPAATKFELKKNYSGGFLYEEAVLHLSP